MGQFLEQQADLREARRAQEVDKEGDDGYIYHFISCVFESYVC